MTSSRSHSKQNMSERRSWTSREIVKQYGIPLSNRVTETASRRQGTHGESRVVCKSRIVKSGIRVYYEGRLILIRMCHVLTRHEKIHDSRENKSFDYIDVTCYMIVLQNIHVTSFAGENALDDHVVFCDRILQFRVWTHGEKHTQQSDIDDARLTWKGGIFQTSKI